MPSLKQLTCSIELGGTNSKLAEYGTSYGDGRVETFVAVPSEEVTFSIHLQSRGYIAPGLAMFVYMDGQYQCNRNRRGLVVPGHRVLPEHYEVDMRVRQKEAKQPDGSFLGREWTFHSLDLVAADNVSEIGADFLENMGTIEVIVLRCKEAPVPKPSLAKQPTALSPLTSQPLAKPPKPSSKHSAKPPSKGPSKDSSKKQSAAPPSKQEKASKPPSTKSESVLGGLFGLFDGAADGYDYPRRERHERPGYDDSWSTGWISDESPMYMVPSNSGLSEERFNAYDRARLSPDYHRRTRPIQQPNSRVYGPPYEELYRRPYHGPSTDSRVDDMTPPRSPNVRAHHPRGRVVSDASAGAEQPMSWRARDDVPRVYTTREVRPAQEFYPDRDFYPLPGVHPPWRAYPAREHQAYPLGEAHQRRAIPAAREFYPAREVLPARRSYPIPDDHPYPEYRAHHYYQPKSPSDVSKNPLFRTYRASNIKDHTEKPMQSSEIYNHAAKDDGSDWGDRTVSWVESLQGAEPIAPQPWSRVPSLPHKTIGPDTVDSDPWPDTNRPAAPSLGKWSAKASVRAPSHNQKKGDASDPWAMSDKAKVQNDPWPDTSKIGSKSEAWGEAAADNKTPVDPWTDNSKKDAQVDSWAETKNEQANNSWAAPIDNEAEDGDAWAAPTGDQAADSNWNPAEAPVAEKSTGGWDNQDTQADNWNTAPPDSQANDWNTAPQDTQPNDWNAPIQDNQGDGWNAQPQDTQVDDWNQQPSDAAEPGQKPEHQSQQWGSNSQHDNKEAQNRETPSPWPDTTAQQPDTTRQKSAGEPPRVQKTQSQKEKRHRTDVKPPSARAAAVETKPQYFTDGHNSNPDEVKPYWQDWNKKPSDHVAFRSPNTKGFRYIAPEEPLPKVPVSAAKKQNVDFQVKTGKGAQYVHLCARPEYLDDMTRPYAIFRFKYRSRKVVEDIFKIRIVEEGEGLKAKLADMSKDQLAEELFKLKMAGKASDSTREATNSVGKVEAWIEGSKKRSTRAGDDNGWAQTHSKKGASKAPSAATWGQKSTHTNKKDGSREGWDAVPAQDKKTQQGSWDQKSRQSKKDDWNTPDQGQGDGWGEA